MKVRIGVIEPVLADGAEDVELEDIVERLGGTTTAMEAHLRFFTPAEAQEYLDLAKPVKWPDRQESESQGFSIVSFRMADVETPLIRLVTDIVVDTVSPWEEAFLWIDAPLQWNREALHLYYRVRQSYGDHRLIHEAPVHYFCEFEGVDLLTFVQIGVVNGWRMHVRTRQDYGRVDISAHGDVELMTRDDGQLSKIRARLIKANIECDAV